MSLLFCNVSVVENSSTTLSNLVSAPNLQPEHDELTFETRLLSRVARSGSTSASRALQVEALLEVLGGRARQGAPSTGVGGRTSGEVRIPDVCWSSAALRSSTPRAPTLFALSPSSPSLSISMSDDAQLWRSATKLGERTGRRSLGAVTCSLVRSWRVICARGTLSCVVGSSLRSAWCDSLQARSLSVKGAKL